VQPAAGVTWDGFHVEHEHPYEAIIETAKKTACDAILMASHGRRGISAIVLGSETVKVLTHCPIPVVVIRAYDTLSSLEKLCGDINTARFFSAISVAARTYKTADPKSSSW
jgi:hypothetical protein